MPHQVIDFLSQVAPFDSLDKESLLLVAADATASYVTEHNAKDFVTGYPGGLFVVNSGQFSVVECDGRRHGVSEGDLFGFGDWRSCKGTTDVSVDSAGIVYAFPRAVREQLQESYVSAQQFFQRLAQGDSSDCMVQQSSDIWLYRQIRNFLQRDPIVAHIQESIQTCAKRMKQEGVSSLLIVDDDGVLEGILTDRDLRTRVVAENTRVDLTVSVVMTKNPVSIGADQTLFDALAIMAEHNIHHLPVVESGQAKPAGILTASDMVRQQRSNMLFLVSELSKAQNLYQLSQTAWQIPQYFQSVAGRESDFDIAGTTLAQATDIMTRKLLGFFTAREGEAPMNYAWVVYGSQARRDQTLGSDQDNSLLLAKEPNEEENAYFAAMAEYVCDGLNKCGIKLCGGNIMASNPELRLSIRQAVDQAESWVNAPTNDAIMHFNIFLDARVVAGDEGLFERLVKARKALLQQPMFLAALARHANKASPPLSMFQRFVFEKDEVVKNAIDIKVKAIAIVNDLVRLYALKSGITVPGTLERLQQLPDDCGLVGKDRDNLKDMWRFLNRLRWRHQVTEKLTDNWVKLTELSPMEKHQLKRVFQGLKRAQEAAVMKFSGGMG